MKIRTILQTKISPDLVHLFDKYRLFYKQQSDIKSCEEFLFNRSNKKESLLFEATIEKSEFNGKGGFAQLYPSFSSVGMNKIYILNDIYVEKELRGRGLGSELITYAEKKVTKAGIKKIFLKTANDNPARQLYEKLGYQQDKYFIHFNKTLGVNSKNHDSTTVQGHCYDVEIDRMHDSSLLQVANLFNKYRIFYKQETDIENCKRYLTERLEGKESIIYEARYKGIPAGFVQLYPSFSSVAMSKIYVLNDLYVEEEFRGLGIGAKLIIHAEEAISKAGIKKISLKTANDNPAKNLYKKLGYQEETQFTHFEKLLGGNLMNFDDIETELTGIQDITITCEE